jgi:putative membrane protein
VPVHAAVHLHVLLAGCVFTAAVAGVDPDPHRAPFRLRAVVLIGFVAAHSALAKHLYGHPPDGVEASDARVGAQLMYYGGDVVDVALIVVLCAQWYAAARPRDRAARPVA